MTPYRILLGLVLGLLASVAHADRIRCESRDGHYQSCPAYTGEGVRLVHQLSREGCWQNDTWGFDRNRIWVTNGCRAEFEIGRAPGERRGDKDNSDVAAALVIGASPAPSSPATIATTMATITTTPRAGAATSATSRGMVASATAMSASVAVNTSRCVVSSAMRAAISAVAGASIAAAGRFGSTTVAGRSS